MKIKHLPRYIYLSWVADGYMSDPVCLGYHSPMVYDRKLKRLWITFNTNCELIQIRHPVVKHRSLYLEAIKELKCGAAKGRFVISNYKRQSLHIFPILKPYNCWK